MKTKNWKPEMLGTPSYDKSYFIIPDEEAVYCGEEVSFCDCLTQLAEQGHKFVVLDSFGKGLYPSRGAIAIKNVLKVEKNYPLKHKSWEEITDDVLEVMNKRRQNYNLLLRGLYKVNSWEIEILKNEYFSKLKAMNLPYKKQNISCKRIELFIQLLSGVRLGQPNDYELNSRGARCGKLIVKIRDESCGGPLINWLFLDSLKTYGLHVEVAVRDICLVPWHLRKADPVREGVSPCNMIFTIKSYNSKPIPMLTEKTMWFESESYPAPITNEPWVPKYLKYQKS